MSEGLLNTHSVMGPVMRTFVCLGCYPIGPKISFEYDFDSINNKWSCSFQSQNKWTWKPNSGQEWGWLLSLK